MLSDIVNLLRRLFSARLRRKPALQANTLRADASDQMPEDVRSAFYDAIVQWMQEGPDGIAELLADVEQAWGE